MKATSTPLWVLRLRTRNALLLPQRKEARDDDSVQLTELLEAANDAAASTRNLYVTFVLFALYFAMTIAGTNDEQLLKNSPIAVPLLPDLKLAVSWFYSVAPWLLVLLHGDLLLHFTLFADKLHAFNSQLNTVDDTGLKDQYRLRLASFPFPHWLAGGVRERSFTAFEGLIFWITLIVVPIALLVSAQVAFLPFHHSWITWDHRVAILADVFLLMYFWPNIVQAERPAIGWWATWGGRGHQGATRLAVVGGMAVILSLGILTVPNEPWESVLLRLMPFAAVSGPEPGSQELSTNYRCIKTVLVEEGYGHPGKRAIVSDTRTDSGRDVQTRRSLQVRIALPPYLTALCPTALIFHSDIPIFQSLHRTLLLRETVYGAGLVTSDAVATAADLRSERAMPLSDQIVPIDLRGRDLRYADFRSAHLSKVDLRKADLYGANLAYARLDGADLSEVTLVRANLVGARLVAARLSRSLLQGAVAHGAHLEGALLEAAVLRGADLAGAYLQGADLREGLLETINLQAARIDGAILINTNLTAANLRSARMTAVTMTGAVLKGAVLDDATLYLNRVDHVDLAPLTNEEAATLILELWNQVEVEQLFIAMTSDLLDRNGKRTEGFLPRRCLYVNDSDRPDRISPVWLKACGNDRRAFAQLVTRQLKAIACASGEGDVLARRMAESLNDRLLSVGESIEGNQHIGERASRTLKLQLLAPCAQSPSS